VREQLVIYRNDLARVEMVDGACHGVFISGFSRAATNTPVILACARSRKRPIAMDVQV
jgi:hypothetical protein